MAVLGYHASHEQFAPSTLLALVQRAERAGFGAVLSSDHFSPWTEEQGQSGFAWSWLGAAMQATQLPYGVVCAPGQRYHPAVVAQAAATLTELFPGRFFVALGSGQFLNEHITGTSWPSKPERNRRLKECVDVIRALWAGETVTHHGAVRVQDAKLYTRPQQPPLLVGPALTPETARWAGSWADALITIAHPMPKLKAIVEAFREGGGAGKPMFLKVQLSYERDEQRARQGAFDQWRGNVLESDLLGELALPKQFSAAAKFVRPEDLDEAVRISASPSAHVDWIGEYLEMGFDRLFLHNVNREQERFIDVFGERVLPAFRSGESPALHS